MNTPWPTAAVAEARPAPVETVEQFITRRDGEIQNWLEIKTHFVNAQAAERAARTKVSKTLFPNPTKGTQHYDLGAGYKVTLTYVLTPKLGDKDLTDEAGEKVPVRLQIQELEDAIIEKHGDIGAALVRRLIKWTPDLSLSEYDKLDKTNNVEADIAAMIGEVLTITPAATPTLEFKEPKES